MTQKGKGKKTATVKVKSSLSKKPYNEEKTASVSSKYALLRNGIQKTPSKTASVSSKYALLRNGIQKTPSKTASVSSKYALLRNGIQKTPKSASVSPKNALLRNAIDTPPKTASVAPKYALLRNAIEKPPVQNGALCQVNLPYLTKIEAQILDMLSVQFKTPKQIARDRKCKLRIVYFHIKNLKEKGLLNPAFQKGGGTCAQPTTSPFPTKSPDSDFHPGSSQKTQQISAPPITSPFPTKSPDSDFHPGRPQETHPISAPPATTSPLPIKPPDSGFYPGCPQDTQPIRLHGQQFVLRIIQAQDSYVKKIGVRTYIKGNNVVCNKDSIEVYANQEFWGSNVQDAYVSAFPYWSQFFVILENRFNVILVKEGAQNIKQVKAHYARVNDELATIADDQEYKVHIRGQDGKVWLLIDFSKGHPELECVHSQTAKEDMQQVIEPVYNSYRENPGIPMPAESWLMQAQSEKNINKLTGMVFEMSAAVAVIAKAITTNLPHATSSDTTPTPQEHEQPQDTKRNYDQMEGYQ